MTLTRPIRDQPDLPGSVTFRLIGLAGLLTAPIGHRLFWRFCRRLSSRFPGRSAIIRIGPDSHIRINLSDPYWLRLVAGSYNYEPELAHVLQRCRDLPFTFLDCGANLGYWSILVSDPAFGSHPTIAIEAAARTCQDLEENCRLNGGRFRVVHAAVADHSGTVAWLSMGTGHAGASLYDVVGPVTAREQVTTLAVDDLGVRGMVVIKLDVEGAEVDALRGAATLLEGDTLVSYEDHAADPTCAPTQAILDRGFSVFWCTPTGEIRQVRGVDGVRAIKTRRASGYNFLGCRPTSTFWRRLTVR